MSETRGEVAGLFRFPVKGLSAEALDRVELEAGTGFPGDRAYAFARRRGAFDPAAPRPLPKGEFHMLAKDAALATLPTRLDGDVLHLDGDAFDLSSEDGQRGAEEAIGRHLGLGEADRPVLAEGGRHRFTDISVVSEAMMHAVSLINLSTVRAFGQRVGADLDPVRFRGNITFDGVAPYDELDWEGRTLTIGTAGLRVILRTERCAATTVNPTTGVRDVFVPRLLNETFGHADLGVYAEVTRGGTVQPGDSIILQPR